MKIIVISLSLDVLKNAEPPLRHTFKRLLSTLFVQGGITVP